MKNLASSQLTTALALFSPATASLYNTVIQTVNGPVTGTKAFNSTPNGNISNWEDIAVWKGIPYGADTSGANRWRAPQSPTPWNATFAATTFGNTCPPTTGDMGSSVVASEDCLNLNVWSSAKNASEKRPVVFWSCPAGGSAAQALFDGAGMAAQGIVFINYNYRVSTFGYLSTPELSEEFEASHGSNSSGNWGMLDQFAALEWVRENIAQFGGDPDHITAMGQSAGSAASYHIVNSPLTKGKIVAAVADSGIRSPYDPLAATLAENYRTQSAALVTGAAYMAYKNISTIAELRALSTADLTESTFGSAYSFGNVLDHYLVPSTYEESLLSGPANDVPLITGNTKDESGAALSTNMSPEAYTASIVAQYGNLSSRVLAVYPAGADNTSASASYNEHWTDTSKISSWSFASSWVKTASSPIYTYIWDHAPPGQTSGAYHESEINYILNNLYGTDSPWEAVDYEIAMKMNGYWANFAKTGNPNLGGSYTGNLTSWESSPSATGNLTMQVGNEWGAAAIATAEQIAVILDYFSEQVPF